MWGFESPLGHKKPGLLKAGLFCGSPIPFFPDGHGAEGFLKRGEELFGVSYNHEAGFFRGEGLRGEVTHLLLRDSGNGRKELGKLAQGQAVADALGESSGDSSGRRA